MEKISVRYRDLIVQMLQKSRKQTIISEENVLQMGNPDTLFYINKIVEENLGPNSALLGKEHLEDLYNRAKKGESCILFLEHYSNLDLPVFAWLIRKSLKNGDAIADSIIAIAGVKLSESSSVVSAFAESFSRIVIAPSRTLAKLDPVKDIDQKKRFNAINLASMKTLNRVKKEGNIILVFPSGTRFRPWEPQTKRGVREIDSYVKSFDNMCLVSINGLILHMQKGKMEEDLIGKGDSVLEVSPVISCKDFRSKVRSQLSGEEDARQAVVDAIMAELDVMHQRNSLD